MAMASHETHGSAPHPLLDINHILQNILSCFDVEELKRARLVCKLWSIEANKLLIKKGSLVFTSETIQNFMDDDSEPDDDHESRKGTSLKRKIYGSSVCLKLNLTLSHNHSSSSSDISASHKDCHLLNSLSWDQAAALLHQLRSGGTIVTGLSLTVCPTDIRNFWKILCMVSEKLEVLNLNVFSTKCEVSGSDNEVRGDDEDYVNENLCLPSLRTLSGMHGKFDSDTNRKFLRLYRKIIISSPNLQNVDYDPYSSRHELFDALKETPDSLQQLKGLSQVNLNREEMQALAEKEFELNHLSFTLHGGFRVPTEMNELLSKLGNSLESLEIDFETLPRVPEDFACGIDLVNLKQLTLRKFYGSIHFVTHMTNLKSLTLENVNLSVALHDEASKYEYKSRLEALKIFGARGSTGRFLFPAVYSDIIRFFPSLKKLRMEYFTDSTLKIIVEGLPYLEELDIPNGIYTDYIFTGGQRCLNNECANNSQTQSISVSAEDTASKIAPTLSSLQKLRTLVLQSPKLTDVGIQGLATCRELRSVSIDSPLISDASLHLLSGNSDLRYLTFSNCYQLTSNSIDTARNVWGKGRKLVITDTTLSQGLR